VRDDGAADEDERPRSWTRYLPLVAIVFVIVAVVGSGGLGFERVVAYRDRLQGLVGENAALAALTYAAAYVTAVALSVPGSVFLTILGGFLFGWKLGGALALVSAATGAVLIFLIARTAAGDILVRKAGPRLKNLAAGFRREAFLYLLFLRFVIVVPFWLTNLAAAVFGVPLATFALATFIGMIPATFTFAGVGSRLDGLIAHQRAEVDACRAAGRADCSFDPGLSDVLEPLDLAIFAALSALALAPVVVRRVRGRAGRRARAGQEPSGG
jgi:uncharacterized membrane protein YdjX (TVP38/TMEM64 family)